MLKMRVMKMLSIANILSEVRQERVIHRQTNRERERARDRESVKRIQSCVKYDTSLLSV